MVGAFVGRVCPIHLGHEAVINEMVKQCGGEGNCFMAIGSCNAPVSMRHFFSYKERRAMILSLFPQLRIVGMPDYHNEDEWILALDDLIKLACVDPAEVTFFGGCDEDVRYFTEAGRRVHILNRFDGTTPKISATEVRDALIHGRPLDGLVNPIIADSVTSLFRAKWEKFIRM